MITRFIIFIFALLFITHSWAGTFDGIWTGSAISTNASSGCGSAIINILVDGAALKGTGVTSGNEIFSLSGSINDNGIINSGAFAINDDGFALFNGSFSNTTASGNWEDEFGCFGTFSLQLNASYASGFDELWAGNAISTSGGLCGTGDLIFAIKGSTITGSIETSFGYIYLATGTLQSSGSISNGLFGGINITVGSFSGSIGGSTGSGTWNDSDCFGTFELSLIAGGETTNVVLVSSILPASRSVTVGNIATAFATIINAGSSDATGCRITPITSVAADFFFQITDPATNALTGTRDTSVDIAAGAAQTFVFGFTPTAAFDSTDVRLRFSCTDASDAGVVTGLNTLLLSASDTPIPDMVALVATINNDGIVHIPGTTGTGFFAVASVNVGSSDTLMVSVDTGTATLPTVTSICETDPATSVCINPTDPTTGDVTLTIDANATPTFAVFVEGTETIAFDPANKRVFVRFKDTGGVTRGSTSVAVQTD